MHKIIHRYVFNGFGKMILMVYLNPLRERDTIGGGRGWIYRFSVGTLNIVYVTSVTVLTCEI